MQLLAPHIGQKIHRQHIPADTLMVKIQRFGACFLGNTLPFPTAKVIAAWNDLPNVTTDNLTVCVKTGLVLLRASPPTPTGLAFEMDGLVSSDPSSNDSHDENGWQLVDDITPPTSNAAVLQALEGSAVSEDGSTSRRSHLNRLLDRQVNEGNSSQATDSNALSSDQESFSSGGEGSSTPVGFDNMVHQWLLDYRARGTDTFIESLIAFGAISVGTALQASRIARAMVKKVAKISYTEGKNLENAIRFSALTAFKKCWELNDTLMEMSSAQAHTTSPSPYGANIASLIGGLFNVKLFTTKDIHLCLSLLLEGEKRFDRLCAMHALLAQANDKLCKSRNLPALMHFRDGITSISKESGEYLWVTTPHSKMILTDILALIERWIVSQAIKREENRTFSGTSARTIRNSAVGPRLRNGPVVF